MLLFVQGAPVNDTLTVFLYSTRISATYLAVVTCMQASHESTFSHLMDLCAITERMICAVDKAESQHKKQLLALVEPVVRSVDNAMNTVTHTFIDHVKDGEVVNKSRSQAVDAAMKGIYDALYRLKEGGEQIVEAMNKEKDNG